MLLRLVILGLFFISSSAFAQQTESSSREDFPNLPYYSYGSGLGLTTPDSTFRLNIRFRMQNRVTYYDFDDKDEEIEAMIRRLRLRFDGFVGDPRFLYAIQLSFAPGDVGTLEEGQNLNVIRDAVMYYRHNQNWNFGFGQTKLPGNRQRINSSGALQLTDRSINNAAFTIDRDFGVFVNYENQHENSFSYNVRTAISTGNGRNWTQNNDTRLAYTGRLELFPFGSFTSNGTLFEGDLMREQTPKLLLGATYHYNHGAQRSSGQTGGTVGYLTDLRSTHVDLMFKYQGFAFQSAYMQRSADETIRLAPGMPVPFRHFYSGYGMDFQTSYLLQSNYELIGRYSFQKPADEISGLNPDRDQFSIGVTKYIWEHSLKLQTEATYNINTFFDDRQSKHIYLRFQIEIGI